MPQGLTLFRAHSGTLDQSFSKCWALGPEGRWGHLVPINAAFKKDYFEKPLFGPSVCSQLGLYHFWIKGVERRSYVVHGRNMKAEGLWKFG